MPQRPGSTRKWKIICASIDPQIYPADPQIFYASQFINLVSGSDLPVSQEYAAGTQTVEMAPNFELEGFTVSLIDTPGFDGVGSGTGILKGMKDVFAKEGVQVNKQYANQS